MPSRSEEAAKEAYKAVSDFANANMMYDYLFAEELVKDHKLLQGYVVKLMMSCISKMAQMDDERVTLQNKEAVNLCRRIIGVVGDRPRCL